MDINIVTQTLVDNRLLRNQQEITDFELAVSIILNMKDLNHIRNLCFGFDDTTEHDEVMFGLIHAIESYDKEFGSEQSLEVLSESLPCMIMNLRVKYTLK